MPRLAFVLLLTASAPVFAGNAPVDFDRDVRPILVKSCFSCHGPDKQRGGLRLDRKADALAGGDSGKVIVPGKSSESLLVKLVSGDPDRPMPPKGEKLTPTQVATLKAWIDQGADWPAAAADAAGELWWSLKPLTRPAVPALNPQSSILNPVDAFVRAKLTEKGLKPSTQADRRTLVRRLSFDLTGLPPTPEEIKAFVADNSPGAYEKLVDRLLASPAYGERWARHWLDVVHYGDTHGYDKDQPRPNAWPYRDYVIRSLNADKPYGQFVREQLAGDVFAPGTIDGTTALGFIAAGPWDLIGHAEVPETKIDGMIARHLDRDDMVGTAMNTFIGLTVQCAQCHNHKFDPIKQDDYYRLQAVFAALDRADRPYHTDPAAATKYRQLTDRRIELKATQKRLEATVTKAAGPALAELDAKLAAAAKPSTPRAEFGYHSGLSATADAVKWVQLDLGRSVPLSRVVLWGCHDDFNNIGAGFGFPVRFKIEASDDPTFRAGVDVIVDRTTADQRNPGIVARLFPADGTKSRYLRVTATKLAPRQNDYNFALAEVEVFDTAGLNVAAGATVTALDSIEAPTRWRKSNLTDGYAPGRGREDVAKLTADRKALVEKATDAETAKQIATTTTELATTETELAKVKPTGIVYAGTVHNGGGAVFRGTGPDGGKPRTIRVLRRGDVKSPAAEVGPGALALGSYSGTFPSTPTEADRRAELAKWTTDPRNPLTWRVIVNRVWQYHFGRGIVATANDFGRMGQLPTHPELLDWLAVEFRDGGQSLKKLHKLIVMSATYRQSSASDPAADRVDAGNAYLWRMTRRKLEAEAVRDAALAVSGKLDRTMYGPPFRDFVVKFPEHSPHYEYHLFDPADPTAYRRSVYRFLARSKPQPFMTVLDCADPSMQVDKRNETLSPLQALALFNNAFMLTAAKHLASRVEKDADPVGSAFRLAVGRRPTEVERQSLAKYAKDHGLANACRVVLNLNEFVFVD